MHNSRLFKRDNDKVMTKSLALQVIKRIYLTEKTSVLAQKNYLTFIVDVKFNKCDIKKACEVLYEQKVESVKTLIQKSKMRRFKGKAYIRSDIKKAMVKFRDKVVIEQVFGGMQ